MPRNLISPITGLTNFKIHKKIVNISIQSICLRWWNFTKSNCKRNKTKQIRLYIRKIIFWKLLTSTFQLVKHVWGQALPPLECSIMNPVKGFISIKSDLQILCSSSKNIGVWKNFATCCFLLHETTESCVRPNRIHAWKLLSVEPCRPWHWVPSAWAKAKHIERCHWPSSHSMLSRVRAPNHLHPLRWVHHAVCLLPIRFWVRSRVYSALEIMLLCEEHIKLTSSSILSLLEQSLVCSVQKYELHALHTKHCNCYSYGISLCSISHYTIFEYMGAIWIAWVGMGAHMSCYGLAWVRMGAF